MRLLKAAAFYFALVFGAGFVLGMVRVLGVAPRLGTRAAELIEAPLMLAATVLAARWTVRRCDVRITPRTDTGGGCQLSVALHCQLRASSLTCGGAE